MEQQKVLNLLNEANDSKFVTRNEIIYSTEVLESNLWDYSDAYILVADDITIIGHQEIQVAFKNCAPFTKCIKKLMKQQ